MKTENEFWANVDFSDNNGCWPWTGGGTQGYGYLRFCGKVKRAHRLTYEFKFGPLPEELDVHHKCENRACCNPDHLQPLPHPDHSRITDGGAFNRNLTHCPVGHEYTPDNTGITVRPRGNSVRYCKTCKRQKTRDWRKKRQDATKKLSTTSHR